MSLYKTLEAAVKTVAKEHKASGLMAHRHIDKLDDGYFADNLRLCLEEARDSVLDLRDDIFMVAEKEEINAALKNLTFLDDWLIRFFHGSAIRAVEFPIASLDYSMLIFRARRELDSYLSTPNRVDLEKLIIRAQEIMADPDPAVVEPLEDVYNELWLRYTVD